MKYIRFFLLCLLITTYGTAMSDNISVNDISMFSNEEKEISINLDNTDRSYVSFQFDIVTPHGISIPANGISLNGERMEGFTYSLSQINDGRYRILVYSMPVKEINKSNGSLLTVKLQAKSDIKKGTYAISIVSQKFVCADGTKYSLDNTLFNITIESIIVKANSYTRSYGDDNPLFGFESDTELDGMPEIICNANKMSPVGIYPIKIQQGTIANGNVSYENGVLTIEPAPLTIIADNKTMVQGEALPEFTATYEGFKNGENEDALTKKPAFSCNATSSSSTGSYDIAVNGAEAQNYVCSYNYGTLTIAEPRTIVVTVSSYSRKYGDENPTFEYTVDGGTLQGTPIITCDATPTSPVGVYDIKIDKGSVSNYNVSFVNGHLTVDKATLSVVAENAEMNIGEAIPTYRLSYSGWKNNENESVLTELPYITCNATSKSAAGQYDITVSRGKAQNYAFSYFKGILTINEPHITITALNYKREYGEPNPIMGYTVDGGILVGEPSISCEATSSSSVGNYNIIIGKGNMVNTNVTLVSGTLTINKAPLTITADDKIMLLGNDLPTFTSSFEGFKLNDTQSVLTKQTKYTCIATKESPVGEYDIRVTNSEAKNYDITFKNGKLTIMEPHIIVKVNSYSREYGDTNPTFSYTVEGGTLQGKPTIQCEANLSSSVGDYAITADKGSITNGDVTFINGILSITKANLVITAENKQMERGDTIPKFTVSYQGFKDDETADALDVKPVLSCQATIFSGTGDYPIIVSDALSYNYNITYVNGTLTINEPKPISVDIENISAGNLNTEIEKKGLQAAKIGKLKVSGPLNGTDILFIRSLLNDGILSELDMTDATIVSGGEAYYVPNNISSYYTNNNEIGTFMFAYCKNLMSIILPSSVKEIGGFALYQCDALITVTIPNGINVIGSNAFSYCPNLLKTEISKTVTDIDNSAFINCTSLKEIVVAEDNKNYKSVNGVLYSKDMTVLEQWPIGSPEEEVSILNGAKAIANWSFASSKNIKTIRLPETMTKIGANAFSNSSVCSINLPSSISEIGMYAFQQCDYLKSVALPEKLEEIPTGAFSYCKNLQYVYIPSGIKKIGGYAFSGCSALDTVVCNVSGKENINGIDVSRYKEDYTSFINVPVGCHWIVPTKEDSLEYLKQPWFVWTMISTDIHTVSTGSSALSYSDGTLTIESDGSGIIRIYSVSGTLVSSINARRGGIYQVALPQGIYIINGRKVILR